MKKNNLQESATGGKVERDVEIINKFGIHARPAALFVKTAAQFECDIFVERNGSAVSGKSIMGVLTLEGHCGAILKLMADGPDAQQAVDALEELIKNKFYED